VDSIAASLLELGFEKNDRFAVWLPNTSENVTMSFVASKLGLIKVNYFVRFRITYFDI
jgi:acyl-coenzyme A synthetase/AMP-(fatty) acid ligase